MNPPTAEQKKRLRQEIRAKLESPSDFQRDQFSSRACDLFLKQSVWRNARAILFYAPLADELNIWPLLTAALADDKLVALPRFVAGNASYDACQIKNIEIDCQVGRFGIREPKANCAEISLNRLDLVLVPGVGFDLMGRRLGRGKGFYDRLLAQISGTKCGVGFDEQIVEAIPTESHDVHLNCILTPTRWIEVKPA